MRAITIPEPGGPDALRWTEVPDAEPRPDEVLVRVAYAGVNRADLLQREGHYPPPPGAPPYPGLECSGTVEAVGDAVTTWSVGDRVCALLAGGGYAELVAVPAAQVMPVPGGLTLREAAALPEVVGTVWSNVFRTARLAPGETLLVHGGSSGIGTMAIQLGARHGARVIVTAGSEQKRRRCLELGAAVAVDYRGEDFVERVREETAGRGADVVLDNMGATYLERNVRALAVGGRLVVIGLQGGRKAELDLGQLLAKRASVTGTSLRSRPVDGPGGKAEIVADVVARVWPAVAEGAVQPVVDRVVPVADAGTAHRVLEASEHVGKVVLEVHGQR
ncbi:MAG: NAD(P)H-quinone oxidoreductase [Actinomycetota bacterium]|nr:NAD(P)H-quinone oxidoreductase [Actinomycetota bacterium]